MFDVIGPTIGAGTGGGGTDPSVTAAITALQDAMRNNGLETASLEPNNTTLRVVRPDGGPTYDIDLKPLSKEGCMVHFIQRTSAAGGVPTASEITALSPAPDQNDRAIIALSGGTIEYYKTDDGSVWTLESRHLPQSQPTDWPFWSAASGTLTEGSKRLLPEIITLPDSDSGPVPRDGQTMRVSTGGITWEDWQAAGGQFQTFASGSTGLPGTVPGTSNDVMFLQYNLANNRWDFLIGASLSSSGANTYSPQGIV